MSVSTPVPTPVPTSVDDTETFESVLLEEFMADKSENTKKSYRRFRNKLTQLLGKPISQTSQAKIIEASNEEKNLNTKQALLNIGILIRKLSDDLSTLELENQREKNKQALKAHVKATNTELRGSGLPSYQDLQDYLEYLHGDRMWREYIINYLLLTFYTRNEDLNLQIVPFKRDMDTLNNFLWVERSGKKVVYRRSNYKTANKYGMKEHTISDKKFVEAVKALKEQGRPLIPNPDQVGYYVKQATLDKVGEGAYVKIVLDHHKTDFNKIREISQRRGTSLATLSESYNLNIE